MRTPITTNRFEKELEKMKKRGLDVDDIKIIMKKLIHDEPLEPKHKNHPLVGNYVGYWECHIHPDWLLMYKLDNKENTITFFRTGTHSDLFK